MFTRRRNKAQFVSLAAGRAWRTALSPILMLAGATILSLGQTAPCAGKEQLVPLVQEPPRQAEPVRVYVSDLAAAPTGTLMQGRTSSLDAGRYRLHVELAVAPHGDPRISDLCVMIRAGLTRRELIRADLPADGSFREFVLPFAAPGGKAAEVSIRWAVGRFAQEFRRAQRLISYDRPGAPRTAEDAVAPADRDDLAELEGTPRSAAPAPARRGVLVSAPELDRFSLRLVCRPPFVEKVAIDTGPRLPAPKGEAFTVFRDGVAQTAIVVGKDLGASKEKDVPACGHALKAGLESITGAPIPIYRHRVPSGRPSIEVGRTALAERHGVHASAEGLNHDGFLIRVTPKRIFIVGRTPRGTRYGVHHLLNNHLRIRKYHPDPLFHVAPFTRNLAISVGEIKDEPDFLLRAFSSVGFYHKKTGRSHIWWLNANGLQYHTDEYPHIYGFHHNMFNIFPGYLQLAAKKRGRQLRKEAPRLPALDAQPAKNAGDDLLDDMERPAKADPVREAEAVVERLFQERLRGVPKSKRIETLSRLFERKSGWQPCFSSPDAARVCAEVACDAFETDPELRAFSLGYNDGAAGYCSCPRCRGLLNGEPTVNPESHKWWNYTPTYVHLLNRVAEEVEKCFPGRMVGGIAYHFTAWPPQRSRLRDNVILLKTGYYAEAPLSYAIASCDRWKDRCAHLGLYDYAAAANPPRIHVRKLQALFKHHASLGGNFYYAEAHPDWAVEGPKSWLMARLLWDNDADIDKMLDDYCADLFGAAAKPMRAYWDLCAGLWEDAKTRGIPVSPWVGPIPRGRALAPHIDRMKALLSEAATLARDERVRQRIDYFRTPVESDMAVLADIGRCAEDWRKPRSSADEYLAAARQNLLQLERLKTAADGVRHKGPWARRQLREADYVPDVAGWTLLGVARCLAQELRLQKPAPDVDAFERAVKTRYKAATQRLEDEQARAVWQKLMAATQPMLDCRAGVPRVTEPPGIDGRLDEAFARQASVLSLSSGDARPGARTPGRVYLGHDASSLYVVLVDAERDPATYAAWSKHDGRPYMHDALSVILAPNCEPERAIYLTVDIEGHVRDLKEGVGSSWTTSARFESRFDAGSGRWTLEMAIPFSDLGIHPHAMPVLGANFLRHYRTRQDDYAYDLYKRRKTASWYAPAVGTIYPSSAVRGGLVVLQ